MSGDDPIAGPDGAAAEFTEGQQTKRRRGLRRWFAGNVEHARDLAAAIGDRDGDVADFVDESGLEHRTIERAAALKHELSQLERAVKFLQGDAQIDFLFA